MAVAVGLRAATGVRRHRRHQRPRSGQAGGRAAPPAQAAGQSVRDAVETGPENTATNAPDPAVDAGLSMAVAAAIRDHQEVRFHYRGDQRLQVEPYRLVGWQRRWYLVARDSSTSGWSSFRLDWMQLRVPGGRRFTPLELPGGDYPAFVLRTTAFAGWHVHVGITVHAPAEEVPQSDQPHRRRSRGH